MKNWQKIHEKYGFKGKRAMSFATQKPIKETVDKGKAFFMYQATFYITFPDCHELKACANNS